MSDQPAKTWEAMKHMGAQLRLVCLCVAVLAVGGCSGSSGNSPAAVPASAQPSEAPTASPAPVVLTIAQARARYVALVAPLNALRLRWQASIKSGQLARQRGLASEYDAMLRSFDAALLTTAWPASVVDTAHKLAEADAADLSFVRAFEVVGTAPALSAALEAYNADPNYQAVATQVELMRTLLGLPKAS